MVRIVIRTYVVAKAMSNQSGEPVEIALHRLKMGDEIGSYFFRKEETFWKPFGQFLAFLLFQIWSIRSGIDALLSIFLGISYVAALLFSNLISYETIRTEETEESADVVYCRSGVSWKFLSEALLGSALAFATISFFVINSFVDNPELGSISMALAMVFTLLIIPITPLIADTPRFNILKTTVNAKINLHLRRIESATFGISRFEVKWYSEIEDPELKSAIQRQLEILLFPEDFIDIETS
ncbi:MAG: hypothetical protein ACXADL_09905 [Candidatus Thorarchaeota archaeon]|jgi:hypothetical protein